MLTGNRADARDPAAPMVTRPSIRQQFAAGAMHNLVFGALGGGVTLLQFVLVFRLAGPEQVGLFTIAAAFGLMLESISDFGIGDRLVQRESGELQDAYDVGVTTQFLLSIVLWAGIVAAAPLVAAVYGEPALRTLVIGMSYAAFAGFLRLPLSLFYREMRYFEQRLLLFTGRLVGFVLSVSLAAAGAGAWALVAGGAGALLASSVPAWYLSPLRPRWRFRPGSLPSLVTFSGPIWGARVVMIGVQQGAILAISAFLSVRDVGHFKFAEQVAALVLSVDVVLAVTIFPALCRTDRVGSLGAAFSKPSRVSMMWACGAATLMILFAPDVIRFALTPDWEGAVLFLRAHGVAALFGAIAYSWDAAFKARGRTLPILWMAVLLGVSFVAVFLPLVALAGREGAAIGTVLITIVVLLARHRYLASLEDGISVIDIARRAFTAAAFAAGAAVAAGRLMPGDGLVDFAVRFCLFGIVYTAILWRLEAALIRELLDLIRARIGARPAAAAVQGTSAP
jgi:PST family polysaccharide transporter